jgi:ATP-dependent Lon protease
MGRKFVRLSLGGVRDEAEIRGHRRTYIGAMPGKIIQSLKKAGTNNPVMLLDEIDKMSTDFRGDPSSALLEVLDPEQNTTFNDHYLDLDYDLSQVMFITTANNRHQIPLPLQDRLEIIELSGYTEFEKLHIATRHLVPKQLERNGIQTAQVEWTPAAIELLISRYTRESGVRSLERQIAAVCRKVAKDVIKARKEGTPVEAFALRITARQVQKYLGSPPFKYGTVDAEDEIGLVNGLGVTPWGGDLLPAECSVVPGKGKLTITGQLGDVMQESARAAMSYVRSRSMDLGLDPDFYQNLDIHVHFPETIRKDGPSAGVTIATALVSALCKLKVRRDVAMTGEITLRGRVLPIGGLKEKVLACSGRGARRSRWTRPRTRHWGRTGRRRPPESGAAAENPLVRARPGRVSGKAMVRGRTWRLACRRTRPWVISARTWTWRSSATSASPRASGARCFAISTTTWRKASSGCPRTCRSLCRCPRSCSAGGSP